MCGMWQSIQSILKFDNAQPETYGIQAFYMRPLRKKLSGNWDITILEGICKIKSSWLFHFQRKVDLRRHKETQHTDLRTLPHSQAASTLSARQSSGTTASAAAAAMTSHPPAHPSHFMSALHRAHFLPPPPPLAGLPPLPPATPFSTPLPHDLSRPLN